MTDPGMEESLDQPRVIGRREADSDRPYRRQIAGETPEKMLGTFRKSFLMAGYLFSPSKCRNRAQKPVFEA